MYFRMMCLARVKPNIFVTNIFVTNIVISATSWFILIK